MSEITVAPPVVRIAAEVDSAPLQRYCAIDSELTEGGGTTVGLALASPLLGCPSPVVMRLRKLAR